MQKWIFYGRVLPERHPLKVDQPICGTANNEKYDLSYGFRIFIANGQIIAEIHLTRGEVDVATLRNLIEGNIRDVTDLIGYLSGQSFDIDLITAVSPDTGEQGVFGTAIPELLKRRSCEMTSQMKSDLLIAVTENIPARMVLADFREAMRIPLGTGFFCYRAIEAMMQSMKIREDEDDAKAWPRLRERLRIERSAIDLVKAHSDFPRHGKPSSISDEERAKIFAVTDEIIRRFLGYLLRGKTPLPEAEFLTFAN